MRLPTGFDAAQLDAVGSSHFITDKNVLARLSFFFYSQVRYRADLTF
ncbi:MAG: hypothetical protein WAU88_03150 [Candidatus Zixiibacteriota bacterium]